MAERDTVNDVWARYAFVRDHGHLDYMKKASTCEDFFAGLQWQAEDLALLKASRRPALTINKIISTLSNVMGEQIYNRTEIAFRPRNEEATSQIADVLTKVFMQISYDNQLTHVRSDVFADGIIGGRGFYDVRLDFTQNLRGEVRITALNPKNVLIDPDADEYDPDLWGDVMVTKWLSGDDVELLYSKEAADMLKGHPNASAPYSMDMLDTQRDRFGQPRSYGYQQADTQWPSGSRHIRVVERQWRKLTKMEHFVDIQTAHATPVPTGWDRERIAQYLTQNPMTTVMKKLVKRVRWTVVAGDQVLHDDWSPYRHFTIVPYFPHFRRGRTVGLVENLLGPQELLNKVSSQELHVVNTTANSGWKIKKGALLNMTAGELEQRGSQTGIVLELQDMESAEKISPNQTPTGLDRISYKAEEHIKTISGVSDYQAGFAREDVAAKAVQANQAAGRAGFAKVLDNLTRTDQILSRNVLDCVQEYYTEQRIIHITTDIALTGQTQPLTVNQMTPEGRIINDLTVGEYEVVATTAPERDTFEDTQFDQALGLRKEGIAIPDKYVIQSSRLRDKALIVQEIDGAANSPEAKAMAQLELRGKAAEVSKTEAEAKKAANDATLKTAQALKTTQEEHTEDKQLEHDLEMERIQTEHAFKMEEMKLKHQNDMASARMKLAMQIHAADNEGADDNGGENRKH